MEESIVTPFLDSDFGIKSTEIFFGDLVGKGNFSEVFKGLYKGQVVAIKKQPVENEDLERYLTNELAILRFCEHDSIISYVGAARPKPEFIYSITEYIPGGDLRLLLASKFKDKLSWLNKVHILKDVADALTYLHERQIIHRDIKTDNIMLNLDLTPKLIDLGFAREVPYYESYEEAMESDRTLTLLGTDEFMAPEVMFSLPYYLPADVYSFGITIFEVCTGTIPQRSTSDGFCLDWEDESDHMKSLNDTPGILEGLVSLINYTAADEAGDRSSMREVFEWLEELEGDIPKPEGKEGNKLTEEQILNELKAKWSSMVADEGSRISQNFMVKTGSEDATNDLRRKSITRGLGGSLPVFDFGREEQPPLKHPPKLGSHSAIERPTITSTKEPVKRAPSARAVASKRRTRSKRATRTRDKSNRQLRSQRVKTLSKKNAPVPKRVPDTAVSNVDELESESESEEDQFDEGKNVVKITIPEISPRMKQPKPNAQPQVMKPLVKPNGANSSVDIERREKQRQKELKMSLTKPRKTRQLKRPSLASASSKLLRTPLQRAKSGFSNLYKSKKSSQTILESRLSVEESTSFDFGKHVSDSEISAYERREMPVPKKTTSFLNSVKRTMGSYIGKTSNLSTTSIPMTGVTDLLDEEIQHREEVAKPEPKVKAKPEVKARVVRRPSRQPIKQEKNPLDKKGFMMHKSKFGFWKKIYVITTSEGFIFFKDEYGQQRQQVKGALLFMDMPTSIIKNPAKAISVAQAGKANCFMVLVNDRQKVMQAATKEDCDSWVEILNTRYTIWLKQELLRKLNY